MRRGVGQRYVGGCAFHAITFMIIIIGFRMNFETLSGRCGTSSLLL